MIKITLNFEDLEELNNLLQGMDMSINLLEKNIQSRKTTEQIAFDKLKDLYDSLNIYYHYIENKNWFLLSRVYKYKEINMGEYTDKEAGLTVNQATMSRVGAIPSSLTGRR